jgi:hypothetical protein
MNLARHCILCDNQKISLKLGTTCGLNDRKPEFNKTCSKIELNEKFENKLKSVNIEYENIKRKKLYTYTYFGILFTIGIAIIVGGYLLGKYTYDSGVISPIPLIIMAIGLAPLGMALMPLSQHRQEIVVAKSKKDKVDEVLNEYGIEYEIDITFGKEIHDTQ